MGPNTRPAAIVLFAAIVSVLVTCFPTSPPQGRRHSTSVVRPHFNLPGVHRKHHNLDEYCKADIW